MKLSSSPIYKSVDQESHQNDRDEEEGASPPVPATVTREILLRKIQELDREFQERTQDITEDFSNKLEQLVSQVNKLEDTIKDDTNSSQEQEHEHLYHQEDEVNDNQEGGVMQSEDDGSNRSQENDQTNCYYREPGTIVYISFGCRLFFSFLSAIFQDWIFHVLGWAFMVISVLTLFGSTYKKKDWFYLIGWIVNMIASICIFVVMAVDVSIHKKFREGAFGFFNKQHFILTSGIYALMFGHAIELLRLLYVTRYRKHRCYVWSLVAIITFIPNMIG